MAKCNQLTPLPSALYTYSHSCDNHLCLFSTTWHDIIFIFIANYACDLLLLIVKMGQILTKKHEPHFRTQMATSGCG